MLARGLASLDEMVPMSHVPSLSCPLFLVGARHDDMVPLSFIERAHDEAGSARKELRVFECGHFDLYVGDVHAENADAQAAFLAEHLGADDPPPTE